MVEAGVNYQSTKASDEFHTIALRMLTCNPIQMMYWISPTGSLGSYSAYVSQDSGDPKSPDNLTDLSLENGCFKLS